MANLLLIPTQLELTVLQPLLDKVARQHDWAIELCGFGPIAAAARTSQLLASYQPQRVLLAGIAGSYDTQLAIGTATCLDTVACWGIGAGTGDRHQSAEQLGWPQWQSTTSASSIGGAISLTPLTPGHQGGQLLTCCSAAADDDDVQRRRRLHPSAIAEDMEGFGVALACELTGTPLQIVRGISNLAGDRDPAHWQIEAALQSVAKLVQTIITQE